MTNRQLIVSILEEIGDEIDDPAKVRIVYRDEKDRCVTMVRLLNVRNVGPTGHIIIEASEIESAEVRS